MESEIIKDYWDQINPGFLYRRMVINFLVSKAMEIINHSPIQETRIYLDKDGYTRIETIYPPETQLILDEINTQIEAVKEKYKKKYPFLEIN